VTDAQLYLEFLRYIETYAGERRDAALKCLVDDARNALSKDLCRLEKTEVRRRGVAVGRRPSSGVTSGEIVSSASKFGP
jgi:hypothetical protein